MASERKNKGRQKIPMTKMSNESNLLVTFSKRRAGLFKKASEICTLCGAEVAIIVFSPGKNVFSFGHPSVETVIDRFLTRNPMSNSGAASSLLEAHRNASVRDLNLQMTQILGQLEAEKKRGEMLNQMKKFASQMKYWWEGPIEELDLDQLEQVKAALEDLKKNSKIQGDKLLIEGSSSNPNLGVNPSAAHGIGFAHGIGLDSHGQDYWYNCSNGQHLGDGGRGFL